MIREPRSAHDIHRREPLHDCPEEGHTFVPRADWVPDGIMTHQANKSCGNVHSRAAVEVLSSRAQSDEQDDAAMNIADLRENSQFRSVHRDWQWERDQVPDRSKRGSVVISMDRQQIVADSGVD
jgi:hypothetical protein